VNLYSALPCSKLHLESTQIWPACNKGITQFYLPATHEPYLPLLLLAGTNCAYPRMDGQAELVWVAGYISR